MNFVIFSYNFLPLNDAEAYCTTRFASALAYLGHVVHVVTLEHPQRVSSTVCDQLIDPQLKITRVESTIKKNPYLSRLRFRTYEWEADNFSKCIKAVKLELAQLDSPILVTRSNPLASSIIGWYCRKEASKWVAHLSDPIPIPGRDMGWCVHGIANRFWMRRVLRDANFVSVTCPNAIRAYKDEYGKFADKTRFIVTPHIGDPALKKKDENIENAHEGINIVHNGVMCAGRGAPELASAIQKLNAEGIKCQFIQCGQVDDVSELFEKNQYVYRRESCPVDIEYIPDLKVPLEYCPFLSSKFVYRVFDDKPILLYTNPDSVSAELARKYRNAGIFVADNMQNDSLYIALKNLMQKEMVVNRERLRSNFTREKIINDFTAHIR